jgi:hypothetical protein
MIQSNFKEWTLDKIDDAFGLEQVFDSLTLNRLVSFEYEIDDFERRYLKQQQSHFLLGGDEWNEVELENKFISPLIMFAGVANKNFSYFLERNLSATIGQYQLAGRVDGMMASGFRSPKKPYFCMSEFKKGTDPDGDPKGQALIAMLVAQALNENKHPIFGCYIIGRIWYFMVLEGSQYCISNDYSCADEEIFDIFRILKSLNHEIEVIIGQI